MRKAKIICTIGPASASEEAITQLIRAGMDVARLNFSHGDHASHREVIERVRQVAEKEGRPVAILQDLQGPKIRISRFANGPVTVHRGGTFTITTRDVPGDETIVSTPYKSMPHDVKQGDHVLLHDGLIRMQVEQTTDTDTVCTVVDGGQLYDRSGITLPGVRISEPSLTDKDRDDLEFGLAMGVDFVALSFVREADDLNGIRAAMGDHQVPVVAKLETTQALDHLAEIVARSDAIMVARGDLGAQISAARVPVVQKHIIETCHNAGIPVITATQMLESMSSNPMPTRAEASDVANAVFDGSDAVMLSVETAFGDYPIKSCETMADIIREAEKSDYFRLGEPAAVEGELSGAQSICRAAWYLAERGNARVMVAFTTTGLTARLLAKYRPSAPIVAFTPFPHVMRQLALLWGVIPMQMDFQQEPEKAVAEMAVRLTACGMLGSGDRAVVTAGSSLQEGGTNLVRLYTHP
ncbi:MAG: pyruvate kinase [Nitrospirota bacterium]|nr:pyruvate kinase [Nitrospirota bacterium]